MDAHSPSRRFANSSPDADSPSRPPASSPPRNDSPIARIIAFSAHNRILVIGLVAAAVAYSVYTMKQIRLDAIPDLSDTQVIVYTKWDRSPDIIEDQVTYPIITALLGAPQVQAMEQAMRLRAEPTVPCNNDLLAENFIDTGRVLRLIDYEYSGNNEPSFELGNVWSESNLSPAQLEELVGLYYGAPLASKVARARLWGLIAKYGWMLWASIQDGVSELEFDFWSWGMEKYERAVAEFDGPDFARLLEEVQRED